MVDEILDRTAVAIGQALEDVAAAPKEPLAAAGGGR
jgi:hypothetical protein